jgi:hypothetical protein
VKYGLLVSVGDKFDVNFVMKEFPADKQFILWSINNGTPKRHETKTQTPNAY